MLFSKAVQNERQPRNTATIRPEMLLSDSNSERLLREGVAATVAAVFGLSNSQFYIFWHFEVQVYNFRFKIPRFGST